jgi:beta-glucosidase
MSHFTIKEDHVVSDDTIQQTNERFEGDADLYDFLVSSPCSIQLETDSSTSHRSTSPILVKSMALLSPSSWVPFPGPIWHQYMSYPKTEVEQPPRHLRGYEKPYLKAGESKTVEFRLVRHWSFDSKSETDV